MMDIYTNIMFESGEEATWITPWYEDEEFGNINPYPELEHAVNYYNGNGEWIIPVEQIVNNDIIREGLVTFVTKLYKCMAILLDCNEKDLDISAESRRRSLEVTVEKKKEDVIMENKRIQAGAFVIPNASAIANEFLIQSFRERTINKMTDICRQFGQEFDPDKDRLIQLWFHSDYENGEDKEQERRLGSDNLSCHGFKIDGRYYYFDYNYLPYKILKDVKEGDILTIEFDCERDLDKDEYEVEKVPLVMDVKFEQLPYRYRNKGRFEEAVRYVL